MEIQYLEINQSNEPNENISDYIKDFSEAATVIDVQCNAIPVHFEKVGPTKIMASNQKRNNG